MSAQNDKHAPLTSVKIITMTGTTENGKFYTPTIDEFHEGFEYEYKDEGASLDGKQEWQHKVFDLRSAGSFDDGFMIGWYIDKGLCRVKHLDHDDMVSLGFKENNYLSDFYYILIDKNLKEIRIEIERPCRVSIFYDSERLFIGTIRNKSELNRILTQIGVTL